eukprot:6957614-Alexandrium_andersonii.AAC.1
MLVVTSGGGPVLDNGLAPPHSHALTRSTTYWASETICNGTSNNDANKTAIASVRPEEGAGPLMGTMHLSARAF